MKLKDVLLTTDGTAGPGEPVDPGPAGKGLEQGTALCLSGGGYRAMLFHLGGLWRLNELGLLGRLDRISSVSGGSIASGVLGRAWSSLAFDQAGVATNFIPKVVQPIRGVASRTIDAWALLSGLFVWAPRRLVAAYRKHLFGQTTLQALPDRPRFVFNALNVGSNALWRFSKPYMGDYKVGLIPSPNLELAVAVAASSAFPPFFSPFELALDPRAFSAGTGTSLQAEPYTSRAALTDGGVYDNLALETAWKRLSCILVSDGGKRVGPQPRPHRNWISHLLRIFELDDGQVRSLRTRQLIASYSAGLRSGAYWSIQPSVGAGTTGLPVPMDRTQALAAMPTRLAAIDPDDQERLINWGYASSAAALLRWQPSPQPPGFPYPNAGV